jgi:hypothetical protein
MLKKEKFLELKKKKKKEKMFEIGRRSIDVSLMVTIKPFPLRLI